MDRQWILLRAAGDLIEAAPEKLDLQPRKPLYHQSNNLYDLRYGGRHMILKEFLKPDEFDTSPKREIESLKILRPLDIAPIPIGFAPQHRNHHPLVIYEFMEGRMWDRSRPSRQELRQLAEVWVSMHTITRPDLWHSRGYGRHQDLHERFQRSFQVYQDWSRSHFPEGLGLNRFWKEIFPQVQPLNANLMAMGHRPVFSRADPRFANVIARPDGRIGMVDWEDAGLRDPAMDLADLLTHPNQEDLLDRDDWHVFLNTYISLDREADPQIVNRVEKYQFIFSVYRITHLLETAVHKFHDRSLAGWLSNGIDPQLRMRRMLARCLAWPDEDFSSELESLQDWVFYRT